MRATAVFQLSFELRFSSYVFRVSFDASTGPATPILCAKKNCGAPRSNAGLMDNSCGVSCGVAHSRRRPPVYSEPVFEKTVTTTTEVRARRGPNRQPPTAHRGQAAASDEGGDQATPNKGSPPPQSPAHTITSHSAADRKPNPHLERDARYRRWVLGSRRVSQYLDRNARAHAHAGAHRC